MRNYAKFDLYTLVFWIISIAAVYSEMCGVREQISSCLI